MFKGLCLFILILHIKLEEFHTVFFIPNDIYDLRREFDLERYNLLFFFDSTRFSELNHLEEQIKHLTSAPLFHEYEMQIMYIDTAKIPKAIEHFKLKNHGGLEFLFYIRNQRYEYDQFDDVWEREKNGDQFDDDLEKFVHNILDDISHEIKDFKQFKEKLNEEQSMILYIGEHNHNFHLFRFLSIEHPNRNFYHVFLKSLKQKILRNYSEKPLYEQDLLTIIRSDELVNNFKEDRFSFTTSHYSQRSLEIFMDYELYPKFRDDSYADHNLNFFNLKKDPQIILFITNSSTSNDLIYEFKQAVKELPRKFIYALTNIDNQESQKYITLFDQVQQPWELNHIYIIFKSEDKKIQVKKFDQRITKNNIMFFLFNFIKEKHGLVEDEDNPLEMPFDEDL